MLAYAHQMLVPMDKAAATACGKTVLELEFYRIGSGTFPAYEGPAVLIKNYYTKITHYEPYTRIAYVCDEKDNYRFGFNGMEKDNEAKGIGNSLDFGARIYDSRLGRWLSVDAMGQKFHNISFSPYNFVKNNPLVFIDPDGNDWLLSTGNKVYWYGGEVGDKKNLLTVYKASSGHVAEDSWTMAKNDGKPMDYRNSKYQNLESKGPTPEGRYKINLKPDFGRVSKMIKDEPKTDYDATLLRPKEGGVETIPGRKYVYPGSPNFFDNRLSWGNKRGLLQPISVSGAKSGERDLGSFYIHDSQKGGTAGCIEIGDSEDGDKNFFEELQKYKDAGNEKIDVIVDYPSSNHSTDGGTKK